MRRVNKVNAAAALGRDSNLNDASDASDASNAYFTYRPLSNLPTPPPTYKEARSGSWQDGELAHAKFRGPAIHLVNLIPSSASLTTASIPVVQAILSRADLPIETVALAVCILDSLDRKFARAWRLACPLLPSILPNKRHTLPPAPALYEQHQHQMLHIDSVPPEVIVLAALVIAVKFLEDPQQVTQHYCHAWGSGVWSHDQLNATERCIMESLNYRIMPLCDEDCLADAMVDMQLAGQQLDWDERELTPPDSDGEANFVLGHGRSKTMMPSASAFGRGLALTPLEGSCSNVVATRGETAEALLL